MTVTHCDPTLLKLTTIYHTGWITVQRGVYRNYDLENSPLQIRTDSVVGSDEQVKVWFFNAGGEIAGAVNLYFTSYPKYSLSWCSTYFTSFPTALPTETDKIWTVTLTRTSGTVRVIIHCNNKKVLNVVLSETTCSSSSWSSYWGGDVEKIKFHSLDTASDYYRPGKQVKFISCLLPILL